MHVLGVGWVPGGGAGAGAPPGNPDVPEENYFVVCEWGWGWRWRCGHVRSGSTRLKEDVDESNGKAGGGEDKEADGGPPGRNV